MKQLIITKQDGTQVPIASRRFATTITNAKQTWELLGNDVVHITVESPYPQNYDIGDKITVFGRVYKLHRLPQVKKKGTHMFTYDLEFEGVQYDLLRVTYDLTIDTTNCDLQDVQADSLTGDLERFATVLIANTNRVFSGAWELGNCPQTDADVTLTFGESDNCLSVLQTLCTQFKVEFEITQNNGVNTIHFKDKVGQTYPHTFQFGKGRGLYALERQNVDSSNIVTRLKVFGSTSNITHKYRANRLCLPNCNKGQSYIEKPDLVAKYGIYEATKYFENIKPTFTGKITSVVAGSVTKFVDTSLFEITKKDVNGNTVYMLDGILPKIHFNSGNLAGYEFELLSYDHATQTVEIRPFKDDRDDEFPSAKAEAFQFKPTDTYKILDIALPDEYNNAAETKLAEEANTYYDQNSQPKVKYALSITKSYLQKFAGAGTTANIFAPGDYIPIKDVDIDVDKAVRVKSLTRNLLDEYEYTLTISDTVSTNITQRVISELIDIDKIININNLNNPARAKQNWRSAQELLSMMFDPEGDYYTDKIKPNSIETLALSVGAKSMQFALAGTIFQPNYNKNPNLIYVKGGVLTHYTINENEINSWILANSQIELAFADKAYYIYAKCNVNENAGVIICDLEQIKVTQETGCYHFWIGTVSPVQDDGVRVLALTYGFSFVNGRYIKTGRIESSGGSGSFFDLDENQFYIGDEDKGLAWNLNNNKKLLLKGMLVQSGSGSTSPLGCYRGVWQPNTTYYPGDEVIYTHNGNTSTYRQIYYAPIYNAPPYTGYWDVVAQGTKGIDSKSVKITANGLAFKYANAELTGIPTPQTISLIANTQNIDNVITTQWQYWNDEQWINISTGTVLVVNYNSSFWLNAQTRTIRAVVNGNYTDQIVLYKVGNGNKGDAGESPVMVFRGEYDENTVYYGTNNRRDVVRYNNNYYIASIIAGEFADITPDTDEHWQSFGAQFESVATQLLLAENANIAGWIFVNNRLESQNGAAYLNGINGEAKFANGNFKIDEFGNIYLYGSTIQKSTYYEVTHTYHSISPSSLNLRFKRRVGLENENVVVDLSFLGASIGAETGSELTILVNNYRTQNDGSHYVNGKFTIASEAQMVYPHPTSGVIGNIVIPARSFAIIKGTFNGNVYEKVPSDYMNVRAFFISSLVITTPG